MTAQELRKIRKQLGLTQQSLADLLGCKKKTVESWEYNTRKMPEPMRRLLSRIADDLKG